MPPIKREDRIGIFRNFLPPTLYTGPAQVALYCLIEFESLDRHHATRTAIFIIAERLGYSTAVNLVDVTKVVVETQIWFIFA